MIDHLAILVTRLPADRRDPLSLALLLGAILIVALQLDGARRVRREIDYHPAYRALKQFIGATITLSVASAFAGTTGSPEQRVGFYLLLLIISLAEYAHILRRNRARPYMRLKTRRGLVDIFDRGEAQLILSEAASIVRHQRLDNVDYVDEEGLQELLDAFDVPTGDEFIAQVREQMRQRRERLANDKIFAAEVDQWRRERDGQV